MLVYSGLVAVAFLGLSLLFAVLRVRRTAFHRFFGVLGLLAAVVHVLMTYPHPPIRLSAGWVAVGALLLLCLSAAGTGVRRYRTATAAYRERRARSSRLRFTLPWRVLHWMLATCATVFAVTHVAFMQPTATRWLYVVFGEGIAVALIGRYVLPRRRPRPVPRHLHTAEIPTVQHETGAVLRTAPVPYRPEKTLLRRVAITTCDVLPLALSYSPDSVLVSMKDNCDLLRYRRELALCGGRAHYFRNGRELITGLPAGKDRELSLYVLCGDEGLVGQTYETLIGAGVPFNHIIIESNGDKPVLPADHPSAPLRPDTNRAYLKASQR